MLNYCYDNEIELLNEEINKDEISSLWASLIQEDASLLRQSKKYTLKGGYVFCRRNWNENNLILLIKAYIWLDENKKSALAILKELF